MTTCCMWRPFLLCGPVCRDGIPPVSGSRFCEGKDFRATKTLVRTIRRMPSGYQHTYFWYTGNASQSLTCRWSRRQRGTPSTEAKDHSFLLSCHHAKEFEPSSAACTSSAACSAARRILGSSSGLSDGPLVGCFLFRKSERRRSATKC